MNAKEIKAFGCREGNLQSVNVSLPYGEITAVTGVSGSGKSSFAFDTLYAEGRRQMLEALRTGGNEFFLSGSCSPQVDYILGLPATIAIRQSRVIRNANSTVGTIAHINPYLYSILSLCGEVVCENCALKGVRHTNPMYRGVCSKCGVAVPHFPPAFFSNMSPVGACANCGGSGVEIAVDERTLYPNQELSIAEGGLLYGAPSRGTTKWRFFNEFLSNFGVDLNTPIKDYPNEAKVALLYGVRRSKKCRCEFPGLVPEILRLHKESASENVHAQLASYICMAPCEICGGCGISKKAQEIYVAQKNIVALQRMTVAELQNFINKMSLPKEAERLVDVQRQKVDEICGILSEIGISYLSLNRKTASLSGGEMHRIAMATFLSARLGGVLYVLDEPSTGLHQSEVPSMNAVLHRLKRCGMGNSVVVVEHNPTVISIADYVVEFGPGPSTQGGRVVFQGRMKDMLAKHDLITSRLLSGGIPLTRKRVRVDASNVLRIKDACSNNLRHVNVDIPLNCLVAVTGVSGSGKSSLLFDSLYQKVKTGTSRTRFKQVTRIEGLDKVRQVVLCEQSPIGAGVRSIVATYMDVLSDIRRFFAEEQASRSAGISASAFSFNTKSGACPTCEGRGFLVPGGMIGEEQHIVCPECGGKRYRNEVLSIKYCGKNISEILDMDASSGAEFFSGSKGISRKLQTLKDVGLGYLRLGQGLGELSGGERQRLKLASHILSADSSGRLYIFDEPCAGLHRADLQRLLDLFDRLIAEGNSVAVVEHNLDLIALADFIIDMGPGGGEAGGMVIACGTPETIMASDSVTGIELKKWKKSYMA